MTAVLRAEPRSSPAGSQGLGLEIARAYVAAGARVSSARATRGPRRARTSSSRSRRTPARSRPPAATSRSPRTSSARRATRSSASRGSTCSSTTPASTGRKGSIEDVDWDEWEQAIRVNLFGSVLCCRALLPHFRANGYGKIVQLSGGGATSPLPRLSAYAASKAAVVRFAETLAEELRGRDRRQRDRAGRAEHAAARRGARGRPGARRRRVLRAGAASSRRAEARRSSARRARRVPRLRRERRHHRQADQRPLGSVGRACPRTPTTLRTDVYTLRRIVPAIAGWPGAEIQGAI